MKVFENDKTLQKMEDHNDQVLIELVLQKDQQAFQELVKKYIDRIFNFTRTYVSTKEEAEDITQDTFFKIWKNIDKYNNKYSFKSWLYTIAKNTTFDYLRKNKELPFSYINDNDSDITFEENIADANKLADEVFDENLQSDRIIKIVENLETHYKTVLTLHYEQDLTFDEIAQILGKPMNTIKSWHRRALLKIKEEYSNPAPK